MRCATAVLLSALFLCGCGRSGPRVVVYCALDREFAQEILKDFEKESGVQVVVRYDSEANKSVGLYEDLVREKATPRCDVHWNNEILATLRLREQGVLAPYASPSAQAFPKEYRGDDDTWTAFAARVRVLIVNTKMLPDRKSWPAAINDLADPRWKGQVALAKPRFGTTASHAACLFALWGDAAAMGFLRALKDNDVQILPGNKQVAVAIGLGTIPLGLTDTDDALAEIAAGNPVEIVFLDHRDPVDGLSQGALVIPNTVALIRNAPNPDNGKKLIDFLLRPDVERKLALAKGKQIPLNPAVEVKDLPRPGKIAAVDFSAAARKWEESQRFLGEVFSGRD